MLTAKRVVHATFTVPPPVLAAGRGISTLLTDAFDFALDMPRVLKDNGGISFGPSMTLEGIDEIHGPAKLRLKKDDEETWQEFNVREEHQDLYGYLDNPATLADLIDPNQDPNAVIPRLFFQGKLREETGLVDFGARYYDPEMGRFISPDPLLHETSRDLYAYADGDPLTGDYNGYFTSRVYARASHTYEYISSPKFLADVDYGAFKASSWSSPFYTFSKLYPENPFSLTYTDMKRVMWTSIADSMRGTNKLFSVDGFTESYRNNPYLLSSSNIRDRSYAQFSRGLLWARPYFTQGAEWAITKLCSGYIKTEQALLRSRFGGIDGYAFMAGRMSLAAAIKTADFTVQVAQEIAAMKGQDLVSELDLPSDTPEIFRKFTGHIGNLVAFDALGKAMGLAKAMPATVAQQSVRAPVQRALRKRNRKAIRKFDKEPAVIVQGPNNLKGRYKGVLLGNTYVALNKADCKIAAKGGFADLYKTESPVKTYKDLIKFYGYNAAKIENTVLAKSGFLSAALENLGVPEDVISRLYENTGLIEGLTKKSARYDRIMQLSANHRLAYANSRIERFRVAYKELLDNPTLTIEQKRGAWRQIIESAEVKYDLKQIDALLDGVKAQKHHIIHQNIVASLEENFPGRLAGFNVNDPVNFVYLPENAKIASECVQPTILENTAKAR